VSEVLLECRQLVKVYKSGLVRRRSIEALRGVNLSVRRGDVYGFLGENGAGKTTTVRCLIGLTPITGGGVSVFGLSNPRPEILFKKVSYCPEESNFFTGMTGRELLTIYGRLYGMNGPGLAKRVDEVLEKVDLVEAGNRRISGYSKGMRQRIGLAQSILSDPELIILDEPARGLDPIGRRRFRDVITEYASRGTTFFINSHTLSEVERTCNRIGIIKEGKVIREISPEDLVEGGGGLSVRYRVPGEPLSGSRVDESFFELRIPDTSALASAAQEISRRGGSVESVRPARISLEDYFIKAVGEEEEIR
jgi:ABC-2 type transport system ATP-binding protein